MVFGLFERKEMVLALNKREFSPGEVILVSVRFEFREPVTPSKLGVFLLFNSPNEDFTKPVETPYISIDLPAPGQIRHSEHQLTMKIPDEPPCIPFPEGADPALVEAWKNDPVLGSNAFTVKAALSLPNGKKMEKRIDIKIKY